MEARINYIKQVLAFYDRLTIKSLSSGQIALWHALMHINNKCSWAEWFTAANLTLEALCGLSRQGINQARNVLKQEGLIDFRSNGTRATSYKIKKLYLTSNSVQASLQDSVQISVQDYIQDSVQDCSTLIKHKHKLKHKQKDSSSDDQQNDNNAIGFWLNQVNPEEAPTVLESIKFWVDDFSGQDEIVVLAIKEMLKNNARSYKYLDKILKTWESKKLDTVDKVKKYLEGRYSNKTDQSNKDWGDWDEL